MRYVRPRLGTSSKGRTVRPAEWARVDARFSVTLIGCGLIGGSIALALRRRWPRAHIAGVDRPSVLRQARAQGILDVAVPRRRWLGHVAAARDALVVLAQPVEAALEELADLAAVLRDRPARARPLVLDVGSVKAPIVALAEHTRCPRFIGGHPMAGSERSGLGHAQASLFDGRRFVLCPPKGARAQDRRLAASLVLGLGAEPYELDAALHDRCVALVSHVPHLVALALMQRATCLHDALPGRARAADLPWRLAAGSWRDATRVAAADPALWEGIFAANHRELADALDGLIETLEGLRDGLRQGADDLLSGGERGGLEAEPLARIRRRIHRYLP